MALAERTGLRLEMGRVAIFTFQLIRYNLLSFLALSVIVAVPAGIMRYQEGLFPDANLWDIPIALPFLTYVVCASLLTAIIAKAIVPDGTGYSRSVARSIVSVANDLVPLTVIALISNIMILVGLFLLVLPGLLLGAILAVLMPVRIVEQTGFVPTFVRSAALTKSNLWRILGLMVAVIAIEVAGNAAVNLMMGDAVFAGYNGDPQSVGAVATISAAIVDATTALVSATGTAVVYWELRRIKDGFGPNELASEFD